MAFTIEWNEGDLGGERQDTIDDLIESTRKATRERANVEHITYADETGKKDVWRHRKAAGRMNYGTASNKPSTVATGMIDGALFYETDTGLTKYFNSTSDAWVTVGGPEHSTLVSTYTTGTVAVTNANAVITGTTTVWSTNVTTADVFLGPDGEYYGITSVDSDTQITLDRIYDGVTANGQSYTVYLDGHPQYFPKSGGTINGDLAVGGAATITGGATLAAALAMGASKITGLADGTAATDAAAYGQIGVLGAAIGTYVGNGVDDRQITGIGFQPTVVVVYGQNNSSSYPILIKTSSDGTRTKGSAGGWLTDVIKSLDADGFTLGTNDRANKNGVTYTYIVLRTA